MLKRTCLAALASVLAMPLSAQLGSLTVEVREFGNPTPLGTYTGTSALDDALDDVALNWDGIGAGASAAVGEPNLQVVAGPGTYDGPIVIGPYSDVMVEVVSEAGPNTTHVFGGNPVVRFQATVAEPSHILSGFAVSAQGYGRGVWIDGGGSLVDDCFVFCCEIEGDGAGIYGFSTEPLIDVHPVIEDSVIWGNTASSDPIPGGVANGGGIALIEPASTARVVRNRIVGNRAVTGVFGGGGTVGEGGGLYQRGGFCTIEGNTFEDNVAGAHGGGVAVSDGLLGAGTTVGSFLDRNRIVANLVGRSDSLGAGVFFEGGTSRGDFPAILRMNVIVGNGLELDGASHPALGGGFYIGQGHESFLLNNTVWANEAAVGGGGVIEQPEILDPDADTLCWVINNLFWDNVDDSFFPSTDDLRYDNLNKTVFAGNVSQHQVIQNPPTIMLYEFADLGDQPGEEPIVAGDANWPGTTGGDYAALDLHLTQPSPHRDTGNAALYTTGLPIASSMAASAFFSPGGAGEPLEPTLDIDGDVVPGTFGGPGVGPSLHPGAYPVGADLRDRRGYLWGGLPYDGTSWLILGAQGEALVDQWGLWFTLAPLTFTGLPQFVLPFDATGAFSLLYIGNKSASGLTRTFLDSIVGSAPYKTTAPLPNMIDTFPDCPSDP